MITDINRRNIEQFVINTLDKIYTFYIEPKSDWDGHVNVLDDKSSSCTLYVCSNYEDIGDRLFHYKITENGDHLFGCTIRNKQGKEDRYNPKVRFLIGKDLSWGKVSINGIVSIEISEDSMKEIKLIFETKISYLINSTIKEYF